MSDNQQTTRSPLASALNNIALRLFKGEDNEKKFETPPNRVWMALLFFNFIFLVIDAITAVTTGNITAWYYGVFVFFAGWIPMILWEALYVNAHARKSQQYIAIGGAVLAALSTISLGVLAGIVNVLIFTKSITVDSSLSFWILIGMVVGMVLIGSVHGVLTAWYFYTDQSIKSSHKHGESLAYHKQMKDEIGMATNVVDDLILLANKVSEFEAAGQGDLLRQAFKNVSGRDLLKDESNQRQTPPVRQYAKEADAVTSNNGSKPTNP